MTELVTGQDFRGFVRGYQHTAFRLEVRDRYNEPGEAEPLQRFLAGESIGDWYEDWEELQRRWAAEGKRMTRVRVVTEPHTDYIRFGLSWQGSAPRRARTSATCHATRRRIWTCPTTTSG